LGTATPNFLGHGDAELFEEFLGLVFVNIHGKGRSVPD